MSLLNWITGDHHDLTGAQRAISELLEKNELLERQLKNGSSGEMAEKISVLEQENRLLREAVEDKDRRIALLERRVDAASGFLQAQEMVEQGIALMDQQRSSIYPPPLVISGPSGVGKGTIIQELLKRCAGEFSFSVSHTTRQPREGEKDGVHYHFAPLPDMQAAVASGQFLEYAEVHGNIYGTSIKAVETIQNQGMICLLDIDVQGARTVRQRELDAHFVFVSPPSPESLAERLKGRGTESEEQVQTRLANAQAEMEASSEPGLFDFVLVNDELDLAVEQLLGALSRWYPFLAKYCKPQP